mmetsp:Transcript_5614/g.16802  ORF Transcript_5614/g.16802 Transcript_5614/m.16802 type:complete len:219 (-) Transcript_5614:65-721(-)
MGVVRRPLSTLPHGPWRCRLARTPARLAGIRESPRPPPRARRPAGSALPPRGGTPSPQAGAARRRRRAHWRAPGPRPCRSCPEAPAPARRSRPLRRRAPHSAAGLWRASGQSRSRLPRPGSSPLARWRTRAPRPRWPGGRRRCRRGARGRAGRGRRRWRRRTRRGRAGRRAGRGRTAPRARRATSRRAPACVAPRTLPAPRARRPCCRGSDLISRDLA